MLIHAGTHIYGKVDQVPGLFYVGTRFFHIWFFPLIPVGSFLVLVGKRNQALPLALSGKSILFAYVRLALLLGGVLAGMACLMEGIAALEHRGGWSVPAGLLVTAALLFYGFYASYRLTRPSPERALELAERAGIPMELLATHFAKMQPAGDGPEAEPAYDSYREDS
jgi:hypothetical protein